MSDFLASALNTRLLLFHSLNHIAVPIQLLWVFLPETVPHPPSVCRKKAARTSSVAASVEMTDLSGLGDLASPLTDGRPVDNHGQSLTEMADRAGTDPVAPEDPDTGCEAEGRDVPVDQPPCARAKKVLRNKSILATVRAVRIPMPCVPSAFARACLRHATNRQPQAAIVPPPTDSHRQRLSLDTRKCSHSCVHTWAYLHTHPRTPTRKAAAYCLLSFLSVLFDECLNLWCVASGAVGGLGLSEHELGLYLCVMGAMLALYQVTGAGDITSTAFSAISLP